MRDPVTYAGFFKGGKAGNTSYWNFYPVAQVYGQRCEMNFPWDELYQGRLLLKQKDPQYGTLRNIPLS